jgi:hypothetical protein
MLFKIGDVEFTKSEGDQFVLTSYAGGSVGIRARVRSEKDMKLNEDLLYTLREGRTLEIEIVTDQGDSIKGLYKINELNWKREVSNDGKYELVFNLGLQKQ